MNANEQLIHTFYEAFSRKDYATMQHCYAANATFYDEAFRELNGYQAGMMWEMLLKGSKDLDVSFRHVQADEKAGSAEWTAVYTFTLTGRKVTNHIRARFEFDNGKIVKHTDHFNFYRWARQAFGITGLLLGWTPFFQNKVHLKARKRLEDYIKRG